MGHSRHRQARAACARSTPGADGGAFTLRPARSVDGPARRCHAPFTQRFALSSSVVQAVADRLHGAPTFEAWIKAWSEVCSGLTCVGMKGYFWNSIKMVVPAVIISTLLGALNGYVLTKWRFRGATLVFGLMLFACFIPFQSVLLPMATILGSLGRFGVKLQNATGFTFGFGNPTVNLVFVHVVYGIGFTTLFFRNYYEAFPNELVKAAQIDGASFFQIFRRIMLPNSLPIIVVTVIYQFTNIWNDFLFASAYAGSGDVMPMTVALNNVVNTSTGVVEYNVNMAAAMIAALPTLLVYVVAGRYFVRGLMAGAVKG